MLHTLMKSPFTINIQFLISMLKESDDFLAFQDGVIIALMDSIFVKDITNVSVSALYLIKEDVYARGLQKQVSSKFVLIDYITFVSLTLKNKQQMIW